MVAVITGSGLGLGNSSLRQLGLGLGGQASIGQSGVEQYLNAANGNLLLQNVDEGLVFDGLPLNAVRTYNSQGQLGSNQGWQFGFSRTVSGLTGTLGATGSTITRTADDGSSVVYAYDEASGNYISTDQSGSVDTLNYSASTSTWTWTDSADEQQETYNAAGQLTSLSSLNTGASYTFSYSNGQLSQISAGDGDTLLFDYNSSGQLTSLSIQEIPPGQTAAVTRQAVTYGYDTQGRLSSVTTLLASDTDASSIASYAVTYTYDGTSDRIASVAQSDGTAVSYTYTENAQGVYQVASITTGVGAAAQTLSLSYGVNSTTVTNATGYTTTYNYNAASELTSVVGSMVNGVAPSTSYTYDANGNVLTATDADGAVTSYQYDASGNLSSVEDGAGNSVTYTYDAQDQLTSKTTYSVVAQGAVGEEGYVPPSGAQTTYYIYTPSEQLAYVIDPLGNVTANSYTTANGLSLLTSTQLYLGATYGLGSVSTTAPPTEADLQAWVSSAEVQSTLGQMTRTDYSYDIRGQLSQQTQWAAVSADGAGIPNAETIVTSTTYSAQGQLLQKATYQGGNSTDPAISSYAYDGLGRLIGSTDPNGNSTSYLYDDSGSTLVISQANGTTTTQIRNSAGQLVSSTQLSATGSTQASQTLYNSDGQAVVTIDPAGNPTYAFYDAEGRLAGTVDATGAVVGYQYDADGNLTQTTKYATTTSTAGWLSAGALTSNFPVALPTPATSSADITTTSVYDAAGHVVAIVNGAGDVTITRYDGDGNPTAVTQYATPLTSDQILVLGASPSLAAVEADLSPSSSDRTTLTIYDADQHSVATIDPTGTVRVATYDGAGNVTSTSVYTTALTQAQIQALGGSTTFTALQGLLKPTAQTIYNSDNQPVATISATGQVSVTTYDVAGDPVAVTQYATPLTDAQLIALGTGPSLAQITADVVPNAGDQTTLSIYSSSHQVLAIISPAGVVTEKVYDAAGNVTSQTLYATPLTAAQLSEIGDKPTLDALQAVLPGSTSDQTNYTVYDQNEHAVATVDAGGVVVTTTYDPSGNPIAQTQYATPLSQSQLSMFASSPSLGTVLALVSPSVSDQTSLTIYENGKAAATVTSSGAVSVISYDASGNPVSTVSMTTPLSVSQVALIDADPTLSVLQSLLAENSGAYTQEINIYDSQNRVVADVYSGYVQTTTYDANGNQTSSIEYNNRLTNQQMGQLAADPTIQNLNSLITLSQSDYSSTTIYDSSNRVVAKLQSSSVYNPSTGYQTEYLATTYTYDNLGNRVVSTNYAQALTSLQADALAEDPTLTNFQSLIVPTSNDVSTVTIYDAENRVVATVTPQESYDYSTGQYVISGSSVATTTYDSFGNVTASVNYATLLTQGQTSVLASSPMLATLATLVTPSNADATSINIYDANDRRVASIAQQETYDYSTGTYVWQDKVTQTGYDQYGNVTSTVQYANALTSVQADALAQSPSLTALASMVNPSPADATTINIYDSNSRVIASVSASNVYDAATSSYIYAGVVSTTAYDAAGNIVSYTHYGESLNAQQAEAVAASPSLETLQSVITPGEADQTTITIYDASERPVAAVRPAYESYDSTTGNYVYGGQVTTTEYDSSGKVISTTSYATALTQSQLAALGSEPTLADLEAQITSSPNDQISLTVYNANEQVVATVIPSYTYDSVSDSYEYGGAVTTNTYDGAGNVIATIQYSTALTASQLSALGNSPSLEDIEAQISASPDDQISLTIYNVNDQPVATITPNYTNDPVTGLDGYGGTVTTQTYDTAGNLTVATQYATALTASQLSALGTSPTLSDVLDDLSSSASNITGLTIYDGSEKPLATIDASGRVVTTSYDGAGNATVVDSYATELTQDQINALGASPSVSAIQALITPSTYDQVTVKIYDAANRLVGTATPVFAYNPSSGYGYQEQIKTSGYDSNGNLVSTVQYSNLLTAAQVQSLGSNPTIDELLSQVTPSNSDNVSITLYDAQNHVIASTSPRYSYDYSTGAYDYTYAVSTSSYSVTGQLEGSTNYATPLTAAQAEAIAANPTMDTLLANVQPSDNDYTSVNIYNSDGQVVGQVSERYEYNYSIGQYAYVRQAITNSYDVEGRLVATTNYSQPLTAEQADIVSSNPTLAALQSVLTPSGNDYTTVSIYGPNNKVVASVSTSSASYVNGAFAGYVGNVTTFTYDASGNVIQSTTFNNPLTNAQCETLAHNPTVATLQSLLVPSESDETNITVYNASEQSVATITPENYFDSDTGAYASGGSVTLTTYDASGNVIAKTQYATYLTASQVSSLGASPTLADIQALLTPSTNDTTSLTIYNSNEKLVAQVSYQYEYPTGYGGYVTTTSYDASGNVTSTRLYQTPLSASQLQSLGATPTLAQLMSAVTPSASDTVSFSLYDSSNRLIAYDNGDGYVSTTTYDAAGKTVTSISYSNPLTAAQAEEVVSNPTMSTLQSLVVPSGADSISVNIYDSNENLIAQITPNGGVTMVTYNSNSEVVSAQQYSADLTPLQLAALAATPTLATLQTFVDFDEGATLAQTFYDASGRVLATVGGTGDVTTNAYDANGNVTTVTNYAEPLSSTVGFIASYAQLMTLVTPSASDATTRTIYDSNNRPIATVDSSGYVTVTGYNAAGDAVSVVRYTTPLNTAQLASLGASPTMASLQTLIAPTERNVYNAANESIVAIDAQGNATYKFYNNAGELSGVVDPDGAVTTYVYDADGHITQTSQYATLIDTSSWLSSSGAVTGNYPPILPVPASSPNDRTTTTIYDAVGEAVASIDAAGNVTTTTFDGLGHAISTTQYATSLTQSEVAALGSAPSLAALQADLVVSPNDRTTTTIYDADGRAVASIDPSGYVTTKKYDADGDVLQQTSYATALSSGQLAALGGEPTLSALQSDLVTNTQDQTTLSYYNGVGEVIAQIDAGGYLSTVSYDTDAATMVTTRYENALTDAQLSALTGTESVAQLVSLLGTQTSSKQSSVTYNAEGQIATSIAMDGTTTAYAYNGNGQVIRTTVTPASGQGAPRTTSETYDVYGNPATSTDADENVTTYVYNAIGEKTEQTDAAGNTTWYYYDPAGNMVCSVQGQPDAGIANALGDVTVYAYDAFGGATGSTSYATPLALNAIAGSVTDISTLADVSAALATLSPAAGDANNSLATTYTADGQVASITDGDGYQTVYSYDAFGDQIQVVQQLVDAGEPLTAANSTTTRYTFDNRGEVTKETSAVGSGVSTTSSKTYDAFGRVSSSIDGNGNTTSFTYDNLDRQIKSSEVVQGATRSTRASYDAFGNLVTQTDALGNTTQYIHDLDNHKVTVISPDGVTTVTVKDAFGDVLSVTDGAGNSQRYTYDADGHLRTATDALGNVRTNSYDADGNLNQTVDATGHVVAYSYDANGNLLTKTVDPNGLDQVTSYLYDGQGRLIQTTDPLGNVAISSYDADGNVLETRVTGSDGQVVQDTTYTYDGDGKVLTATQGAGSAVATTTQYVYDSLERLTDVVVDPNGLDLTTSYTYDANGNVLSATDPNGNTTYSLYNEANEVVYTVTPAGALGTGQGVIAQNWYNANGQIVSTRTYSTLVGTSQLAFIGSNVEANLSVGQSLAVSATTADDATSYNVYDNDGRIIFQIDPMGNVKETRYNALGQVAETLAYADPISIGATLATALQSGTVAPAAIRSALEVAGDSDNDARQSFAYYDADGRIAYTVVPNLVNGVLGAVVTQTQYDAAGRVASSTVYGVPLAMSSVGDGSTTASIAAAVAATNTPATTSATQYIYDAAGEQVAQIDPNGNASFIFYDADGRVALTVDALGDAVQFTRDALGRITQQTSFANTADTSGWLVNGVVQVNESEALPSTSGNGDRLTQTTYDAVGRVATVSKYTQVQYEYNYDPSTGQWTYGPTYTGGDTLTYAYDNDSRVVQTVDFDQTYNSQARSTSYFYDADGNTIGILNADGYLTTNSYDAAGQLVQTTAYATFVGTYPEGGVSLADLIPSPSLQDQTTTNFFDALGNLAGSVDADGYVTQYSYDLDDNRLSTTRYAEPAPLSASDSLDAILASVAGSSSHQTVNTYDAYGDLLTSSDYEGVVTQYVYDDQGNVVQTTQAAGAADARATSSTYDAFGNITSTTDGTGAITTYTYDLANNRTSATDALGNTAWYAYDADDRLVFTVRGVADDSGAQNALGEVSGTSYDAFGDVTETVNYSDRITAGANFLPTVPAIAAAVNAIAFQGPDSDAYTDFSYDLEGNVVNRVDANGNQTIYKYDGFNELVTKSNGYYTGQAGELVSQYTYDALGHMTSEIDEESYSGSSEYNGSGGYGSYDQFAVSEIVVGSGGYGGSGGYEVLRELQWTYDAFGNVATYTDGDANTTSYTYDGLDQQTTQSQMVSGALRETSTNYDAYGRVLTTSDAMGLTTTFTYDDTHHSMVVNTPGGVVTTTSYNDEGQTIAVTDAAGDTTSYHYDADGRLIQSTNPDGGTVADTYDAVGNQIQSQDADGNVTAYTYDAAGRVLTQTVDPAGLDLVTTYAYDGRGLQVAVTDPTGAETSYVYDGNGNVIEMEQGSGAAVNDLSIETDYAYNDLNEVTGKTTYSSGVDGEYTDKSIYQYDALGRLTGESVDTGSASSINYTYDGDGNVTSKTVGEYTYDAYGDIQSQTNANSTAYYFYNEADQQVYAITPSGSNDDVYTDENGSSVPTGSVIQTSYNADGQVVATTQYAQALPQYVMQFAASGELETSNVGQFVAASADDRTTYQLYNSDGQIEYSIDPTGAVTETRYNALGQVSETLAYATPVSVSSDLSASILEGTASASDIQAALSAAGDSDASARITFNFYDSEGRVCLTVSPTTIGDVNGGIATGYAYDADGNLVSTTRYGALVPAAQFSGNATTSSLSGYLAGATDTQVSHDVYDADGRLVYTIDALGDVAQTQYDGDGRVTWNLQYANAIGTPSSWTEAGVAAAVQAANPDSSSVRGTGNVYDSVGNVVQTLDKLNATPTATYTYDDRGLKVSATDRDGNTTTYSYDSNGNLLDETSPPVAVASYDGNGNYLGTVQESLVTSYQYNTEGQRTSKTEASNTAQASTTQYLYDAAGNLVQTINPDPGVLDPQTGLLTPTGASPTVTISYDAFGDAVVSQDANGNYAYNAYDQDGRLAYAVDGDGYVTGYQYNAYGQQTSVTRYAEPIDTSALVASGAWSDGQPLSLSQLSLALVTSASDRTITTTYDSQGNKTSVTQPPVTYTNADGTAAVGSPVTQYTYDTYGNITSESVLVQGNPADSKAVWATTYNYYDALGRQVMTVDPMGYVTTNTYDAFGDVVSTTQWATAIATQGLVAGGSQPANPPAGNAATTGLDRLTNYGYDNDGNKISQSVLRTYVDASGNTVEGYVTTTFGYDGENRATSVTENGQTVATQYDALGRVTSITGPQQQVLVSNWQALLAADPSLDLTSASLYTLGSQVVSYTYDALGNKLTQSTSSTASSQSVTTYNQYDNAGRMVASVTPLDGGSPNWTSDQVTTMTYDNNGNLLTTVSTLTGDDDSTVLVTTSNTYDADNQQLTSITMRADTFVPDKSVATQYDAFGEVTATGDGIAVSSATTYDNAGNRSSWIDPKTGELHTYGYNLAGQQVVDTIPLAAAVGGTTSTIATLDLDGRVVAEQAPSTNAVSGENTGTLLATYDRWGNVLSSTDASGNITTYTYNDRNQVVTQTGATVAVVAANGVSTSSTPVKTSAYDAEGNLVSVTDENGNVTRTAVDALGQTIETIDGTGAVSYVAYDALGNEVADQNGNGNITFKNVDALGRVVQQGHFVLSSDGLSRTATWQQAYVLDQDGNRIISYDGIGSAYLQSGDTTDAALHANYDGYDSQGHVIWSQDAAQRAASVATQHASQPGSWTQAPSNADFSQVDVGWDSDPGWVIGNGQAAYEGSYGGNTVNQDRVPVVPGQTITALSPPILIEGPHGGGVIGINWYDASGNLIGSSGGNIVAVDDSGQQSSVTGTAPAGAAFASVALNATNYGESTVAFAGTVTWDYVPPAGATSTGANGSLIVWLANGSYTQQPANPDFEDGDTGWDKGAGWAIVQGTNTSNGSWVAGFNGDASGYIVNQDRVPVTPGQTISASIQVSLYLAPDGAEAAGAVAIQWFDAAGNLISTSLGNVISSDHKGEYHTSSVTAGAPPGAAYASLAAYGSANGIGGVAVDAAVWNYQYIPAAPTGVVQDTYVYDMDGNLVGQTTADRDSETWNYNAYGQVTNHTDLSGANYNYTYDASTGALIGESDNWSPTAQGQATPAYVTAPITTPNSSTDTYYADGQLATQTYADGSSYSYSYDANGNTTRVEAITVDGNDQPVHTVTQTTYDSHNRLSHVVQTNVLTDTVMLDETYTYDAAGNRREVSATSGSTTVNAWYTYDGDNRVAVSAGSLVNGQVVVTDAADSYAQTYDADGNVTSQLTISAAGDTLVQRNVYDERDELVRADYAVDVTTGGASKGVEETRTYDADGHVLIDNQYYALGTTLGALPDHHVDPDDSDSGDGGGGTNVGGELDTATIDYYDSVGRLAAEQTFGQASGWDGSDGGTAPTSAPGVDATTFGSLSLQSEVVYQGAGGTAGYDADGDVVAYQYRDGSGRIDQYAVTYLRKDGYLQSTTSGENVSDTPNVRPSTDESVYDDRGNLVALTQHTQYAGGTVADTVRVFAYDGNGEIIERQDGTAAGATLDQGTTPALENQHYVYVDGQQVAHYDDAGTVDVLSEVTAFSSSTNGPNDYVVQGGDTLESIAQAEYGDASLWYVIAQANALSSDNDLSIGQRLTIPQVTTNSNTATTVKPYDPSAVVGSTTPNLPTIAPPPPPPSNHCNALAEIVEIAVVLVVSFYVGPEATALLGGSEAAGAAVAGAAGSIAGQLTGDVEGIHQGLDLAAVGESALAAGLTAGATSELKDSNSFLSDSTASNGLSAAGDAVQAAANYVDNVVASKLTDESTHFSWAGLVANSVAGAVSGELGSTAADTATGHLSGNYLGNIAAIATGDVVDREVSLALGDNHVQSWAQIGESIGGNALANGAIAGINAYQAYQKQQQASQLPPLQFSLAPIKVPALVLPPLVITDIPQTLPPVTFSANGTDTQTTDGGTASGASTSGATTASNNGSAGSSSTPSSMYFIDGQPRLYFVDPNDSTQGGNQGNAGTSEKFNSQGTLVSQLGVDQEYLSQGAALSDKGLLIDPASFQVANQKTIDAGTNGFVNGGVYDPTMVAAANEATHTFLANNGMLPKTVNLQTIYVTGTNSDNTTSLPPVSVDIGPPDISLNVSTPSVPAYAPSISPVDVGQIQINEQSGPGLLDTLSNAYQSLAQNYKASEAQADDAANRFHSLVNTAESSIDSFRVNLAAYGINHGGSLGGMVGLDIAGKIGEGEGVALEAIDTVSGLANLAHNAEELTSPAAYIFDPQSNIDRLKTVASTVKTLDQVALVASVSPQFDYALAKSVGSHLYQSYQQDPAKFTGRASFEVASIAVGGPFAKAGEVREGLNVLEEGPQVVSDLERTDGIVPSTVVDDSAAGGAGSVTSEPQWLQRIRAGNAFDDAQAVNYPYNEVYIDNAAGDGYTRLDSYDPNLGEIVSRKFTQLSDVQESTAVGYINEIPAKYPVGATIADVPSSGTLAGSTLQGQYILEVPVQVNPVPQAVLDAANNAGVLIRDVNGKIY